MYLSENHFHGGGLFTTRRHEEDHEDLNERLRKTLYYGKLPGTDRPSLPVTDLMVDFYNEATPKKLGKLDNYLASSTSRSACVSPSATVVGMMYVKKLKSRRPDYLTQVSSSELFLISMMMASKFLYDEGVDDEVFNDEWANSADMETEDVNQLEMDFLKAIDWHLFVSNKDFSDMLQKVEKRVALQQGIDRGWFSYTDLDILTQDLKFDWNNLTMELSTVFSAASFAYLAGLLTMVGSTVLGTMTSVTLINAGSTLAPMILKITPSLSLYPALSVNTLHSMSRLDLARSNVNDINLNETDADDDIDQLEPLSDSTEWLEYSESENKNSDLETDVKVIHKEPGGLLNGFLSPFLAMITLKDTLFSFAYGAGHSTTSEEVSDSNDLDLDDSSTTFDLDNLEFCSNGACLIDSWKNCLNVTINSDWTIQNDDNKACCPKCTSNDNHHNSKQLNSLQNSDIIHCCCNLGNHDDSWLKSSLHSRLLDINLRFMTKSVHPILVTT
ncbi:Cyclin-dependent protein kinase [Mactra antiquata]